MKLGKLSGTGIATGVALGVALGVAFDDLVLGIALGICLGTAFEPALAEKDKPDKDPKKTDNEPE